MAPWIVLPNDVVRNFTGRPLRTQRLDVDLEPVYKPIACPAMACDHEFTNLREFQEHVTDEHEMDLNETKVSLFPELDDVTTATLIQGMLLRFNTPGKDNPLSAIRRTNDAVRATEVWRRVQIAIDQNQPVRLKDKDHEWLVALLTRKLPLTRADKELGEEQQTVGMMLYGLAEDNVNQALLPISERRELEPEREEEHAEAVA